MHRSLSLVILLVCVLLVVLGCSQATPTPMPTATPTMMPTPTPTLVPTPLPTATPVPTATPTPIPSPTATFTPTATPTNTPTPTPTFTPTPSPTPTPTATPIPWPTSDGRGLWFPFSDVDPLTSLRKVAALLYASGNTDVALIVRCNYDPRSPDVPEVFINWDGKVGSEFQWSIEVFWRLDDQEAQSSSWGLSTDKDATFYPDDVQAFIWELLTADKLVARVLGQTGLQTDTFTLTGLSEALRPYRDDCDWVGFETG